MRDEAQKVHVVALVKFVQRSLIALDRGDVLALHQMRMCEVDPYFGHMVRRRLAELRKHLFRFLDAPRLKEHCGRPIGRKHVVGLAVEHVGVTVEGPGEILYIYI